MRESRGEFEWVCIGLNNTEVAAGGADDLAVPEAAHIVPVNLAVSERRPALPSPKAGGNPVY